MLGLPGENVRYFTKDAAPTNPSVDQLALYADATTGKLTVVDSNGNGAFDTDNDSPGWFNVKAYGAQGDARKVSDAAGVITGNHVRSETASFTAADLGKTCWLVGSNNFPQLSPANATILAVNSPTDVTVSSTVLANSSNGFFTWGTDDTMAVQAAVTAAKVVSSAYNVTGGPCATVFFPFGGYILNAISAIDGANKISVTGAGMYDSILYIGPGFPYFNTGAGNVITNAIELSDFTLDGGNCHLSLGNIALVDCATMRRVRIYNWLAAASANCTAAVQSTDDGIVEDVNIYVTCQALGIHSLQQSIFRAALQSTEVALVLADTSNIRVVNSFISGNPAVQEGPNSHVTDLSFSGCKIIGTGSAVNMTKSGSMFRFDMCWLIGNPAFTVPSGMTIYCANSTVIGTSTDAVDNAGDFWDLGGNIFTGAKAGGGTYHTAQFA